jgi:hypothetical protein
MKLRIAALWSSIIVFNILLSEVTMTFILKESIYRINFLLKNVR